MALDGNQWGTEHTRLLAQNLRSISQSQSVSQSVNIVTEDLVAGHRPNGKMSTVRRFFCLIVTFDILFTSLMWLICVMLRGDTLKQIFDNEIIHYDCRTSLFDIVMLAITRFVVLLLFYGLLYINHWCIIALSTAGTCGFLVAKVVIYDWPAASQPVYQVFLILASFTIAWGEAWFLDFRVMPQELQAKEILEAIIHHGATERTPLIPHHPRAASTHGESTVNWFSPVETPESSPGPRRLGEQIILTQEQIEEYKELARENLATAWQVLTHPTWKVEKRGNHRGDVVESTTIDGLGKVYRFTGVVECPADFLYREFRDNITKFPEWNPTIVKSELIKEIAPGIDLTYQVSAGGGGGFVSSRDFVLLRCACAVNREGRAAGDPAYCYVSSGVSVAVPGVPPGKDLVRGHNKIGTMCMKPFKAKNSEGKMEERTYFQWLMCCDLKVKLPQFLLDAAFGKVMLEYIVHVRKLAAQAKAKGQW